MSIPINNLNPFYNSELFTIQGDLQLKREGEKIEVQGIINYNEQEIEASFSFVPFNNKITDKELEKIFNEGVKNFIAITKIIKENNRFDPDEFIQIDYNESGQRMLHQNGQSQEIYSLETIQKKKNELNLLKKNTSYNKSEIEKINKINKFLNTAQLTQTVCLSFFNSVNSILDKFIFKENDQERKKSISNIIQKNTNNLTPLSEQVNLIVPEQFKIDIFRCSNPYFNKKNYNSVEDFVINLYDKVKEKAALKIMALCTQEIILHSLTLWAYPELEKEGRFYLREGFDHHINQVKQAEGRIQFSIDLTPLEEVIISAKIPMTIYTTGKNDSLIEGFFPLKTEIKASLKDLQKEGPFEFDIIDRMGKPIPIKRANDSVTEEEQKNIALQEVLKILNNW